MNPEVLVPTFVRDFTNGPEVTWVGPNPFADGMSLGFDDGSIMFSDLVMFPDLATGRSKGQRVSEAKESINGIAAIGTSSLAVSTLSDVTFLQLEGPAKDTRAVFAGGAHGVISTQSGYFIAPLGMNGLLIVKPDPDANSKYEMTVTTGMKNLYFYRMAVLRDTAGTEVLVFANRQNGVGVSPFHGEQNGGNVRIMRFEGLDVVDVCGVSSGSLSAVAISSRGEVLWLKDASKRDEPLVMRSGVEGQVYRVLATTQHLFVLSSKALYIWSHLVESVLLNQDFTRESFPHVLPVEAVDMSLLNDDELMLVMGTNSIMGYKIDDIIRDSSGLSKIGKLEDFTPRWVSEDVEQIQKVAA